MIGTINQAIKVTVQNDNSVWSGAVMTVIYGYGRQSIGNQLLHFYLISGIAPRFSGTDSISRLDDQYNNDN